MIKSLFKKATMKPTIDQEEIRVKKVVNQLLDYKRLNLDMYPRSTEDEQDAEFKITPRMCEGVTPVKKDKTSTLEWVTLDHGVNDTMTLTLVFEDGWQHSVYLPIGERRQSTAAQLRTLANLIDTEGSLQSSQATSLSREQFAAIEDVKTALDPTKIEVEEGPDLISDLICTRRLR